MNKDDGIPLESTEHSTKSQRWGGGSQTDLQRGPGLHFLEAKQISLRLVPKRRDLLGIAAGEHQLAVAHKVLVACAQVRIKWTGTLSMKE